MSIQEKRKLLQQDAKDHPYSSAFTVFFIGLCLASGIYNLCVSNEPAALFWAVLFAGETIAISIDAIWKTM